MILLVCACVVCVCVCVFVNSLGRSLYLCGTVLYDPCVQQEYQTGDGMRRDRRKREEGVLGCLSVGGG